MNIWLPEHAEAIPFSRTNLARVLDVPTTRLNNWIDRNRLWQTHRGEKFHRYYGLKEVFDLAGFAALRIARIPETDCAKFVYNYGFYRTFIHGDQLAWFSYGKGKWDIGIYNPSAPISLTINMRTLGEGIFRRLSESLLATPAEWPNESYASFRNLYLLAVRKDRLGRGSAPHFERRV